MPKKEINDIVIIGGGIAAHVAAIYNSRAALKPIVISAPEPDQLSLTSVVENYPGFPKGIMGPELIKNCKEQAEKFGARYVNAWVKSFKKSGNNYEIGTDKEKFITRTVIISTGASARWLGVPGEDKYKGKGVSTCATCLPTQESIIANSSIKSIESIQEGGRVLTHDGTFQEVAGVTKTKYKGDLIKIKTRYFTEPVLLTPNHPVLALNVTKGNGNYYWRDFKFTKPKWVNAGTLKKGDVVLYPIIKEIKDVKNIKISDYVNVSIDSEDFAHNLKETYTSNIIPNKIKIDKNFMRLVGYYLSEGCINKHNFLLCFSKKEKRYIKDSVTLLKKVFGLKASLRYEGSVCRVEVYSNILCRFFEALFSKLSYNKRLPHWIMLLPIEKQGELIKGFFRGDGCKRKEDFVLVTNSRQLTYQFRDILLRFGVIPGINRRNKDKLNKKVHKIDGRVVKFNHDKYHIVMGNLKSMKIMEKVLGEKHPMINKSLSGNDFAWIKDNKLLLPITEVNFESYDGYVHNFGVNKNNTYVAKNFIVHNCDAALFRDKEVIVVGGGDSAMEETLALYKFAKKITIVHRRDSFRASKIMQARVLKLNDKIKILWDSDVAEIYGNKFVEGVKIKNVKTNKESELKCQGVFLAIGHTPNTKIFDKLVKLDKLGYVVTDKRVNTNLPGVFAAGDVQDFIYKQAVTSAGTGCMAAIEAEKYIENLKATGEY